MLYLGINSLAVSQKYHMNLAALTTYVATGGRADCGGRRELHVRIGGAHCDESDHSSSRVTRYTLVI